MRTKHINHKSRRKWWMLNEAAVFQRGAGLYWRHKNYISLQMKRRSEHKTAPIQQPWVHTLFYWYKRIHIQYPTNANKCYFSTETLSLHTQHWLLYALRTNTFPQMWIFLRSSVRQVHRPDLVFIFLLFLQSLKRSFYSYMINKTRAALLLGPLYPRQADVLKAERKLVSCLRPINELQFLHFTSCPLGVDDERRANGPEMSLSLIWSAVNNQALKKSHRG